MAGGTAKKGQKIAFGLATLVGMLIIGLAVRRSLPLLSNSTSRIDVANRS